MTPTPAHRSTQHLTQHSKAPRQTPDDHQPGRPSSPHRAARRAAGGVLVGLALASGAALGSSLLPSSDDASLSVAAQTDAAPSPIAAPAQHRDVRASRSRTAPVAKRAPVPTKQVVRTVPVGNSFSGEASWYGGSFQGQGTANGETFDTNGYTAASKTLPFGTRLRVCHDGCVVVRINDRGPYVGGRILDLTRAASEAIGFSGVANVTATPIDTRTVTVVDQDALTTQRAHRAQLARAAHTRHAAAQRKADLARAAAALRQQVEQANQAKQAKADRGSPAPVPAPASAAVLAGSVGGLLRLRRTRP